MRIIDENLYLIEFGEPQLPNQYFTSNTIKPIYVVAPDYTSAEKKGSAYLNKKLGEMKDSVLTSDGSLDTSEKIPPKIISVKLLSDEVIY